MGEGTPHVTGRDGSSSRVAALGAEAADARDRLDALLGELGRRRDEVLDWRTQLRRHRREVGLVVGGIAVLAAAGLALNVSRRRRRAGLVARVAELSDRADRFQHALGRVIEDPDRLAPEPSRRWKWKAIREGVSLAVPVIRILLPHVAAALAKRSDKRPRAVLDD